MAPDPLYHQPPYFQPASGLYEVAPGLGRLDRQAEPNEHRAFQVDRHFAAYRERKQAARVERFAKYVQSKDLAPDARARVAALIVARLVREHPEDFHLAHDRPVGPTLMCRLTGESLVFNARFDLIDPTSSAVDPPYHDALDALACQVQEDLAIVSTAGARHWLSYLHLCFPNRWSAEEKIGGSFASIHEPVAGMEQLNRRGDEFVRLMIGATDGLVRFAWGITFDPRPSRHPHDPATPFDPDDPRAFLRVERQTIWGLPDVGAALFTIRTYVTDCATLDADRRDRLASAIVSMSEASARYKGLAACRRELVAWLRG